LTDSVVQLSVTAFETGSAFTRAFDVCPIGSSSWAGASEVLSEQPAMPESANAKREAGTRRATERFTIAKVA
jgi:hypothetical protein